MNYNAKTARKQDAEDTARKLNSGRTEPKRQDMRGKIVWSSIAQRNGPLWEPAYTGIGGPAEMRIVADEGMLAFHASGMKSSQQERCREEGGEETWEEERGKRTENKSRWLKRLVAPLAIGLAVSCGSVIVQDRPDADEVVDAQEAVPAEVEQDVPEVPDAPDEGQEEDGGAEDAPPEVEEDIGPEEVTDVPDAPEIIEDADTEAEVEDVVPETETGDAVEEADAAETADAEEDAGTEYVDTYDCTETIHTERGTALTGPEFLCRSTQTTTPWYEVTSWVGADCEATTTPVRRMIRKEVGLSPYLDVSGLGCARTRTVRALNGDEVIVTLTDARLETASRIICADMGVGDTLDGGVGEYKYRITDVRSDRTTGMLFDPDGVFVRNVHVFGTGYATINPTRALIANDFDGSAGTARVCMIVLPTIIRDNGGTEVWTSGDWGTFTWNTNVVGTQLQGWEWWRP